MPPHQPTPAAYDIADLVAAAGTVALFAGLWLWVSLGCALTVIGALLLTLGIGSVYQPTTARSAVSRRKETRHGPGGTGGG